LRRPFAGIARNAAAGNILAGYDTCVIDDVFPRRHGTSPAARRHLIEHQHAAVDAVSVSLSDLVLEPLRDVLTIHVVIAVTPNAG
jgi:hypothetical protein